LKEYHSFENHPSTQWRSQKFLIEGAPYI
jgi:hypothetical protein